jgi:hypothetical protein
MRTIKAWILLDDDGVPFEFDRGELNVFRVKEEESEGDLPR